MALPMRVFVLFSIVVYWWPLWIIIPWSLMPFFRQAKAIGWDSKYFMKLIKVFCYLVNGFLSSLKYFKIRLSRKSKLIVWNNWKNSMLKNQRITHYFTKILKCKHWKRVGEKKEMQNKSLLKLLYNLNVLSMRFSYKHLLLQLYNCNTYNLHSCIRLLFFNYYITIFKPCLHISLIVILLMERDKYKSN